MKLKTKLTKIGRDPKKNKGYVNPAIYKGSTIIFNSYKSNMQKKETKFKKSSYVIPSRP